ncbi:hypothetical protein LJR225_000001 [Phenylobacterium sp. LjRoot225]|uniref:hypothetical protein n=1 Tax=Phenylobacterium sp. LjRoot225 TaxID=3342285 RepID=UPI003ED0CFA1
MGVRLNWLAVEGADKATLLARLGFVECGMASDELSSPLACAVFPGGWFMLVSEDMGLDLDEALPLASTDGLALGCEVEEHVMFSRLRAFRGGAKAWVVTHDPDVDPGGVAVEGEPPPPFLDLRAALAAEQAEDGDEEVDHMFDLPARLGEQLCGYAYNEPRPVAWKLLERSGRTRGAEVPPQLPHAFTSELLPLLQAAGWTRAAQDPDYRGRVWDVTRVIEGRRQLLSFIWSEDGPQLQFETSFLVLGGARWTDQALVAGEIRPVRAGGQASGKSLWRRIADQFRTGGGEQPMPDDRLAQLVARVKEDLAAIDAFLASGDHGPRILVSSGSADGLRPSVG